MTLLAYEDIGRTLPGRECLPLIRTGGNYSRRHDRGVTEYSDSRLIGFHARVCQRAGSDHLEERGFVDNPALWADEDPIIAHDDVQRVGICFDDCLSKLAFQGDQSSAAAATGVRPRPVP